MTADKIATIIDISMNLAAPVIFLIFVKNQIVTKPDPKIYGHSIKPLVPVLYFIITITSAYLFFVIFT
jgi:hypothetical protein